MAADRLAMVPEPIELATWDAQFARLGVASRSGARPARWCCRWRRMYPRKRLRRSPPGRPFGSARRIPGVRIRIVGRGPEWQALDRLHAELGLGETVALLGDVTPRAAGRRIRGRRCLLPSLRPGRIRHRLPRSHGGRAARGGVPGRGRSRGGAGRRDGAAGAAARPRGAGGGPRGTAAGPRAWRENSARRAAGGSRRYTPERVAERFLNAVRWTVKRAAPPTRGD